MLALCLTVFLAALPRPSPAPASNSTLSLSDDALRTRAEALVNNIDSPIPESAWKELGDRGAELLAQIAQDGSRLPTRRARAVAGMAVIGGTTPRSVALKLSQDASQPLTVRLHAVRALARVVASDQLVGSLKPLLEDDANPKVRATAAEVMTAQTPDAGCAAVNAHLKKEAAATLGAFERATQRCKP